MKLQYIVVLTLLMLACHSKPGSEEIYKREIMLADSVAVCLNVLPACEAPPAIEMARFIPPVIKDAVRETDPAPANNVKTEGKAKKIIKDGNISIKVEKIEVAKKRIDILVKAAGAYYENEEFHNYDPQISYALKIRVPSGKFESFLSATEKGEGEVMNKYINARDVTEEYVDGEIRLTSKKLFRTRYKGLLSKAGKVVAILEIEENIRTLLEEIENQEGHLKFLDDQVAYSTLDVNLFKLKEIKAAAERKETFGTLIKTILGNGWDSVVSFVLWSVKQWPWLVLIFIVVICLKRCFTKRRS